MWLGCLASGTSARQINVIVQPPVDSHARAFIEVIGDPVRIWSFPNSYAGVTELGIRIELETQDDLGHYEYGFDLFPRRKARAK